MGLYAGDKMLPGDITKKEIDSNRLLKRFYWSPTTARTNHDDVENDFAIAAGMGSLPNHYIARVSAQPQIRQKSGGDLYRSIDPMAGDVTFYEDHHFQIIRSGRSRNLHQSWSE
eukprot:scaffold107_cov269-Chaetoceros_neogracile.AAC.7